VPASEGTVVAAPTPTPNHSAPAISAAPPAAVVPSAGIDPDGLRSYRMALAVQARRFKRYPAQALASGWEGTAEVRLAIAQGGRPAATEVVKSSGYAALDRAAQAMIEAAAARAALPSSLQGAAFAVTLPVVFNLEDQ
jgi:protein TonB